MNINLEDCGGQKPRTKSCGDVPRQLFLPFSSRVQVSSSFKFHVFLLLQPFLNVCYFTLLTPFRFAKGSKGVYILQKNPVQQVLSSVVIISATIYALLDLRFWLEQNLKEKPHHAFRYASHLLRGFIPLLWGFTFLVKRKWFSKLLVVCQGKRSYHNLLLCPPKPSQRRNVKPNWKLRGVLGILMVLTIGKVLFDVCFWDRWENMFLYNVQVILYNLYQYDWEDSGKEAARLIVAGSWGTNLMGDVSTFLHVVDVYVEHMFDFLCFIGGTMVYAVCDYFADEMEKLSRAEEGEDGHGTEDGSDSSNDFLQSKRILKSMQRNYIDLVAILDCINEVFGSLIVLYFLRSYPNLVWCVFGLFRKTELEFALFYSHKIFVFVLITVTAAEGNAKVGQFKQWLFRTSMASLSESEENHGIHEPGYHNLSGEVKSSGNVDLTGLNILHREVSTEKLGLKGYKFFTVTHGLIGTMLSIVVTYAIVMLQFEMEAEEAKRTLSTSINNGTGGTNQQTPFVPFMRSVPTSDIVNMTMMMEDEFNESIYVNQFKDVVDM